MTADGELVVLVTTSTREEAMRIGRRVVEKKLAACATVVPGVVSIFAWDGAVEEASECLMALKSNAKAYDALETEVRAHHSYTVPEILALPVVKGSGDYLAWLNDAMKVS